MYNRGSKHTVRQSILCCPPIDFPPNLECGPTQSLTFFLLQNFALLGSENSDHAIQ